MYFAIYSSSTLVQLLLFGYSGVAQFFPGVVLGLYWKRTTGTGVLAGLITGVGLGMLLFFTKRDPYQGWNAGFLALCVNFAVTAIVSRMTTARSEMPDECVNTAVAHRAAP